MLFEYETLGSSGCSVIRSTFGAADCGSAGSLDVSLCALACAQSSMVDVAPFPGLLLLIYQPCGLRHVLVLSRSVRSDWCSMRVLLLGAAHAPGHVNACGGRQRGCEILHSLAAREDVDFQRFFFQNHVRARTRRLGASHGPAQAPAAGVWRQHGGHDWHRKAEQYFTARKCTAAFEVLPAAATTHL